MARRGWEADSHSSAVGGETSGLGRSREGRVGVSPQRRERRAVEGSAFQREGAGRLKCQTPAPRPPRVGGAWGGGGAAALPPRKIKGEPGCAGVGSGRSTLPSSFTDCEGAKARKVAHVCAFPRGFCGQARGLLCLLHLPFKWPPSVSSSLSASGKNALPALASDSTFVYTGRLGVPRGPVCLSPDTR